MQEDPAQPNILIVDDTPDNLRLLSGILVEQGYIVRPAANGPRALTAARVEPPDLILLDIKMPDMDGYAVCEQLKADERTREIPVIFISALDDIQDKVKGFALGGVDYIIKPFQAEEVLARVQTHLALHTLQIRLEEQNRQLQQEIAQRQQAEEDLQVLNQQLQQTNQELAAANTSKDTFFSIIAHDLRTPFTSLIGLTEVMLEDFDRYEHEKLKGFLRKIHKAAQHTYTLLTNLLTWSRLERGVMEYEPVPVALHTIVRPVIDVLTLNATQKQIVFDNQIDRDVSVYADVQMVNTVIRNLLSNALKFTPSGGKVTISAQARANLIEIAVADTGIGMTPKQISALFRIDTKTSQRGTAGEEGTGLGLILCKELVEKNGGTIRVESTPDHGSTFFFPLPKMPPGS
jgi:two-component system, sensor histidine kinase and response regulator